MPTANPLTQDLRERDFRSSIVELILAGRSELALELLSKHYDVNPPKIGVGTVKGHRSALACYVEKERRIYVSKSEYLSAPSVILHEFYHHVKASEVSRKRQVEKRADLFAANYIQEFRRAHVSDSSHRSDGDR